MKHEVGLAKPRIKIVEGKARQYKL